MVWSVFSLLGLVVMISVTGCTHTGTPLGESPSTSGQSEVGSRTALIRQARGQLGVPYRYGGADPRGFDCSGLVFYLHRQVGIETPRSTLGQRREAQRVAMRDLQSGDLLFFMIDDGKGRHVAVYEGDGVFIHAPSSGKLVSRARLDNPYWRSRVVGAGSFF